MTISKWIPERARIGYALQIKAAQAVCDSVLAIASIDSPHSSGVSWPVQSMMQSVKVLLECTSWNPKLHTKQITIGDVRHKYYSTSIDGMFIDVAIKRFGSEYPEVFFNEHPCKHLANKTGRPAIEDGMTQETKAKLEDIDEDDMAAALWSIDWGWKGHAGAMHNWSDPYDHDRFKDCRALGFIVKNRAIREKLKAATRISHTKLAVDTFMARFSDEIQESKTKWHRIKCPYVDKSTQRVKFGKVMARALMICKFHREAHRLLMVGFESIVNKPAVTYREAFAELFAYLQTITEERGLMVGYDIGFDDMDESEILRPRMLNNAGEPYKFL